MRKKFSTIFLLLAISLILVSYAVGEKKESNGPETATLGILSKIYEPVKFSHGSHTQVAENCAKCHHNSKAGQTPTCHECHLSQIGSKGSTIPGLKEAYHGQCISCHKALGMSSGCRDCHSKKTSKVSSKNGPETCNLNKLEKLYEPVLFSHNAHTSLADDCAVCHHHSPVGETWACGVCHGAPFDSKNLDKPGLKGAYHLQCMGCHKEVGSGPVGCAECHSKKNNISKGNID